jgi:hypothetical protein
VRASDEDGDRDGRRRSMPPCGSNSRGRAGTRPARGCGRPSRPSGSSHQRTVSHARARGQRG